MRIVGNKLIARRNRGDTITFRLEYENGEPFVIASGWDNPHFVMTIASSRYTQEQRYIKSWWLSLEDKIRVEQTDIYLDTTATTDTPNLNPVNWAFTQIVKVIYQGTSYFWYSDGEDWIAYTAPLITITFTVQNTAEWIEQNYRWDCSIMAGTLTEEGQGKPPLKDFVVVKSLVEDAEMEVSSDSMGGLKNPVTLIGGAYNLQSKTVTPTAYGLNVTPDNGYDALSSVAVNGDTNLVAGNVKNDVAIFGVTGSYTGSMPTLCTVTISRSGSTLTISNPSSNGTFVTGYKIYDNGTLITTQSSTSYSLLNLGIGVHSVTVKAYGTNFNDSVASNEVTYQITEKLATPVVFISGAIINWELIPNASGYLISYAGVASGTQSVSAGTSSYDLEGLLATLGTYTVTVTAKGTGDYTNSDPSSAVTYTNTINYSVTNTLTNCTSNNSAASASHGASYSATLTAASGYTLTGTTASVTMGGVDITSTAYSAGVITISSVTGAIAITVSAIQSVPTPSVGLLITMNLDGTNRQYRVLKLSGEQAEVVCMSTVGNSTFASDSTYAGNSLDTYLNNTWYNTLTAAAKAAIVSKTFNQDSWYWGTGGSPVFSGHLGDTVPGTYSYSISKGSATYGAQITRNVYALSVQDVIDHITNTAVGDGELDNYNVWKMFWNTTTQPSISEQLWLRSARAGYADGAWYVSDSSGSVRDGSGEVEFAVRPALTIDLSNISWS